MPDTQRLSPDDLPPELEPATRPLSPPAAAASGNHGASTPTRMVQTLSSTTRRIHERLEPEAILRSLAACAVEAAGADAALWVLLENGRFGRGELLRDGSSQPVTQDGAGATAWSAANRRPFLIVDATQDARLPRASREALGITALMGAPVLDRTGQPLACIEVYHKTAGAFGEDELALLQALADIAATALESAGVLGERDAALAVMATERDQQARILETTADALTIADVSGKITFANAAAHRIFGLQEGGLIERSPNDDFWKRVTVDGKPFPDDARPFVRVMRTGLPVNDVIIGMELPSGERIILAVNAAPLRDAWGNTIGVASSFRDITEQSRAQEAQKFLFEAGGLLASSLDYETTLQSVAKLATPRLGDWCTVHVVDADGTIRQLAVTHVDPEKVKWAYELQKRYPPDWDNPRGLPNVLRTGKSEIYPEISDEMIVAAARDEDHLRIIREVGMKSVMIVPMVNRQRVLGGITLISAESGRRYTPINLALAESLAHRAAMAVDNARLFQEVTNLNEQLQWAMAETHHRVKNNLQIMAAMVDMQLMEGGDSVPEHEMRRLVSHIKTLAVVHDILTVRSKSDATSTTLSACELLEKLLPLLEQTGGDRKIVSTLDDAELSARQGTSLALVTNELVSNALKYGVGPVEVSLTVSAEGEVAVLEVRDRGEGFPQDFDPVKSANTGIDLVENLSRWDLGGTVGYLNRPDGGALVRITIPLGRPG